jgi:hypothetical protein
MQVAQLPPDGEWLIQQLNGEVFLFRRYTEEEVVRFDPSSADATSKAQKVIYDSNLLNDEQKCFAHFWSGYFYGYATAFRSDSFAAPKGGETDGEEDVHPEPQG